MFEALIHRATNSVESVVARYAMRVAIAIPFIFALGFGLAALTIKLADLYGAVMALAIVAAGFVAVGLVGSAALAATEHGATNVAATETAASSPAATQTASGEASSLPSSDIVLAALGAMGPRAFPAIPAVLRFLARHWALVVSVVLVIVVLLMEKPKAQAAATPQPGE